MNAFIILGFIAAILYGLFVDGTYFKIYFALIAIYIVFFQFIFINRSHLTKRKNITAVTWGAPTDPTSYIVIDFDCTKTIQYLKKINESQKDQKVTITHLMSKGMLLAAHRNRRDVGRIKWGHFQKSERVGVTVLVDSGSGKDLVPVSLFEVQNESILEIAKQTNERVMRAKNNQDKDHNNVTEIFKIMPTFIMGVILTVGSYVGQCLGISVPFLSIKANGMGQCVLTNVGTLGLEQGFAPLPCPLHCMYIICAGKITPKPVVVDGQIVIKDLMNTVWTIDHRYGDAALGLRFIKIVKDYTEDPDNFDINKYQDCTSYQPITAKKD
eukprot:403332930